MFLIYLLVFNANLFIKHKKEYVVNTIFQRIFLARHWNGKERAFFGFVVVYVRESKFILP